MSKQWKATPDGGAPVEIARRCAALFNIPGVQLEMLPPGLAEAGEAMAEATNEELGTLEQAEADMAAALESMIEIVEREQARYLSAVTEALTPHLDRHVLASMRAEVLRAQRAGQTEGR